MKCGHPESKRARTQASGLEEPEGPRVQASCCPHPHQAWLQPVPSAHQHPERPHDCPREPVQPQRTLFSLKGLCVLPVLQEQCSRGSPGGLRVSQGSLGGLWVLWGLRARVWGIKLYHTHTKTSFGRVLMSERLKSLMSKMRKTPY